ncbi:TetR/AcrR family transcriptional regulator [Streptomyces sp. BI20]|uniref:TetR/AcrR family transcriptional regulator n=1 Tax=Streptomyces sp. BI20 TaxID=3403460 RepID=UPI003C76FF06
MPRSSPATDRATPALIAETALRVIDEEGPHRLSFRVVAARLGVSHATVQRRCGDVDGLLDLCVEQLAERLPEIPPGTPWAEAAEARFTALHDLLADHAGLLALRGGRPWMGLRLLERLVEPALAESLALGMSPAEAMACYRRMYLLTLGSAAFVDHRDPARARETSRAVLAGLDPERFPALTADLGAYLPRLTDPDVYRDALRALIAEAGRPHGATPAPRP